MKIIFAADMSLNYLQTAPTVAEAKAIFADVIEEFNRADFSFLNLETVFGEEGNYTPLPKCGPSLLSTYDFFSPIEALRPSALGLANNHARDFGDEALADTMKHLTERGYPFCGAGMNVDEAYKPHIFEKDGTRVAIYAIAENEPGYADVDHGGMAGYNITRVTRAIFESRERGEIPVIFFHGGNEHNPFPSPGKTDLYRHFVDLGAAAVIAMHTHCPQGNEYYKGAPIIYSMGNFFFPKEGERGKFWDYGYLTLLDVTDGKVSYEIIPYTFGVGFHRILRGEEREYFLRYVDRLSAPLSDPKAIRDYFCAWCAKFGIKNLLFRTSFDKSMLDGTPKDVALIKNILGCEAHNEVVTTSAAMIYEGRLHDYDHLIPEIDKLQNLEI